MWNEHSQPKTQQRHRAKQAAGYKSLSDRKHKNTDILNVDLLKIIHR